MSDLNRELERWAEWESEIGWHIPDNLNEGARSQREELEFAVKRAYDEIREAEEVADAVDRIEAGEDVKVKEHFDYTSEIDREYDDSETQLRDELGYELADIGIFTVKISTGLQENVGKENREGYRPDFQGLAEIVENHEAEKPENAYREAINELGGLLEPEGEMGKSVEEMPMDEDAAAEGVETLLYGLSDLSADLPRSFTDYMADKMEYNRSSREPKDIDSSVYDEK
jgi:hypothetical protein